MSRSDVDVMVIRDEPVNDREITRSSVIDEIPLTLGELETVPPVGSVAAGYRWQFAWAEVLRDRTDGRVTAAVLRQATLTEAEQRYVLIDLSRLDGFINFAYRALKSHRDGRSFEARVDSAESVASLLDVVFALNGRVRPYNKYLAWELREHPLDHRDWQPASLLPLLEALLDGSEAAMRAAFAAVERACLRCDRNASGTVLRQIVESWGADLALLRGTA